MKSLGRAERAGEAVSGSLSEAQAIGEAGLARVPGESPQPRGGWRGGIAPYLAVGAGAALGANLRYGVGLWFAAFAPEAFPWGTLFINLGGSLLLGLFLTIIGERVAEPPLVRLFVATGFLGAYTTFSTLSAETVALGEAGRWPLAVGYAAISLIGGYGAAWVGIACGRLGRRVA